MKKQLEEMSLEELQRFQVWLKNKTIYVEFLIKSKYPEIPGGL